MVPPPPDPLAPSERSRQIQSRLTGYVAYLYAGPTIVWWVWETDRYEFGQTASGLLTIWEQGAWWVQQLSGRDYLVLDRQKGGQLLRTDAGSQWRYYEPSRHLIPFVLLGSSLDAADLQIQMDVGRPYTYRLAPLDSLEAIKAHTPP